MRDFSLTVLALFGAMFWGYATMASLDRAYARIDVEQQETHHSKTY